MALVQRVPEVGPPGKFIFCLLSDGELNEGQNWEAIMLAAKNKLNNLICFVDRNNIQIDGNTEDVMPLDPLDKKFEAFNWHVQTADGHNFQEIYNAIEIAKNKGQENIFMPSIIICKTIPGKGVAEFEKDFHYHGYLQKKEDGEIALKRLKALRNLNSYLDSDHN